MPHKTVVALPDSPSAAVGSGEWNEDHEINEAELDFTDVTTANASTTQHGLARKLSGILTDTLRGDGVWTPPNSPARGLFYAAEFLWPGASANSPWGGAAIASGTSTGIAVSAQHPGVARLNGSGTTNGGYSFLTSATLLLAGGESTDAIWCINTTANTTAYIGFHDTASVTAPTDGAWIDIAGTTLLGRCKNNAGPTDTASTYAITQGVWYRSRIVVNADASRVDFYLYTCSDGALVWSDSVAANIPTAAGRETGHGIVVTNTGTGSSSLMSLDYLNLAIDRVLVR